MLTLNTNIMSLTTQNYLNITGSAMGVAAERLASGKRINSSKDDAAGLAISDSMSTRIAGPRLSGINLPLAALAAGDSLSAEKVKTAIAEASTTTEVWDPSADVNQIAAVLPQTSSWLGSGANEAVNADEITETLGADYLANLAQFLGLDIDTLAQDLSNALPSYINSISPSGEVVETLAEAPLDEADQES
ncbi:flagellin N-terminal helical domain-containing protein [Kitasatospora sp. NPDC003701]